MQNNISRRKALKTLAASGALGFLPSYVSATPSRVAQDSPLLKNLVGLRRKDGAYAWHGQPVSHLTPTLFVIGCYRVLGIDPPEKSKLAKWVWQNHPQKVRPLFEQRYIFDFQHIQALSWLGEDLSDLKEKIDSLKEPRSYNKYYERHGYPPFQAEAKHFKSCELLGLPPPSTPFIEFLEVRRRDNGSFNNSPASDGGDGNMLNTWWGLEALHTLGRSQENRVSTIKWLQSCQLSNGGFTHQPKPQMGGLDDVAYTWAAIRSLQLLNSGPKDEDSCVKCLHSLANADGGFSDRPGWLSNPMATYYAVDALSRLAGNSLSRIHRRSAPAKKSLPDDLNVFSMQIESHGRGSPVETVELARALKIHLWGAKNAQPGWREKVKEIAASKNVPVTFFLADEEYGSLIDIPGMGTYSHIADIMAPSGVDIGESLAKDGPVTWPEFRKRRLKPLEAGGGRLVWQFGQHEELIRLFLDESLEKGGYSAISTFHFGNIDFTTSEPFLHRWRGQIPYISLQDAHGNEPWWFCDQTEGMRTLFLGREPTWEAWLEALENNWVAAVRHDYRTKYQTWMHTGSDEVADFMSEREIQWRWWNNPEIKRPLVSMVAVRTDDEFEVARPERGINLRIRLAHRNSNHGLLREPLAEFVELKVNGQAVSPEKISVPSKRSPNSLQDQYYHFSISQPGQYTTKVTAINLEAKKPITQSVLFSL